jgi:hypothetical protein
VSQKKVRYETVFRWKAQGKTMPKIGLPSSVQPGDWLEFWLDGPQHGRFVSSVHPGYVIVEPLKSAYGLLDGPCKVEHKDVVSAHRRFEEPEEPEVVAEPEPPKKTRKRVVKTPEPEAEPEPVPEPEPEPPKKRPRVKKKPPPGILAFLDARYRDGD